MAIKVEVREHTYPKRTPWGVVQKSLGQHIVLVENSETGQMIQAGYVGDTAFLPLAGFPKELVSEVTAECSKQLGKPLYGVEPPPTVDQVAEMLAASNKTTSDDDETEDE